MSQVYQRVMSDGDWELTLKPDTPRSVLDKLVPWTVHVVICPGELDVTSTDSVFLAAARYVGVVRRLGRNRLSPGGPHICSWMSDPDGKGNILTSAASLSSSATLSNWISALDDPDMFPAGTVTSPGGTFGNTYQWVSHRQAITSVCNAFGVEWKMKNDFTLDVGTVANLYRSVAAGETPAAVVARNAGGRDAQIVGIRSAMETAVDWEDYVSEVYVIGNGTGSHGGPSPFRKPIGGGVFTWRRVVQDPVSPLGSLSTVAQSVYNLLPHAQAGRRELRVSTDLFDVAGDVTLGDDVYVWDPENGITDTTNQVHYQGQLIYPQALRCIGMRWPVRRGMGVYLRIQNSSGTPTYENITPYVEFSEGAAELELGTASRMLQGDFAGGISEVTGQVQFTPWLDYTPTWTSAGTPPAIGNGTLEGKFKREGTTLHLRIRMRSGTTTTYGSANGWTFSLPSGMTAYTGTDHYQMLDGFTSVFGVGNFRGGGYVSTGGTVVTAAVSLASSTYAQISSVTSTIPGTWPASTAGSFVAINGTIEVAP